MRTYRARSSAIWGWTAIGVGILIAVVHAASVGVANAQGGLGLGLAAAATGLAAFLRPHVAAGEDAVEVHNVLTVTTTPYARLDRLETRWTLELVGDDGRKAGSFAAPAPGAAQAHRIRKDAHRIGDQEAAYGSPGDHPGTPSGDAAAMVRERWDAWKATHPDAPAGSRAAGAGASSTRRLDPVGAALVAIAVVAGAWGLFG